MNIFFQHLLTGKDNETYDIARVLWALGTLVYLGLSIYAMVKGEPWNPLNFGAGLGTTLAAGGIGIAIKSNTEPKS